MTAAPQPRRNLSAGQEIDAWCTRCKLDLGHRIIAMFESLPKRVVCMTCNSEHNYHAPKTNAPGVVNSTRRTTVNQAKPGKAPKTVKTKAAGEKKAPRISSSRAEWERRVHGGGVFRRYSPSDRFKEGELVAHSKFGEGYVLALLGNDKLTIVFSDGEKTLVHGLAAP
jgi:hypothetical protein